MEPIVFGRCMLELIYVGMVGGFRLT